MTAYSAAPGTAGSNVVNPLTTTEDLRRKIPEPLSNPDEIGLPTLTHDLQVEGADKILFEFTDVSFDGNTKINSKELRNLYKNFIGKTVSVAELLGLIKKTTILYKDRGYILSQAYLPEQKINKKSAKIKIGIIEGYVKEFRLKTNVLPPLTRLLVEQYANRLISERPLTKATMERYALLLDDIPGVDMRIVFEQSQTKGAADIEVVADDNKIFGLDLFTNNRGTRAIGPDEYSGTIYQFNGLYGNQTSLGKTVTYDKELTLYIYRHRQPLNSDGLALSFTATRSRTNPNYAALPAINRSIFDTPGTSNTYLTELEYAVIRSRLKNLILKAKYSATNNNSRILDQDLFKEKLRMFKVEAVFDWLDSYFFNIIGHTLLSAELTQGIDAFGAYIRPEKGLTTRPNVDDVFTKVNFVISRTQPIMQYVNARVLGLAQYASDELVSSEEFGFGGRVMGLGYDAFQISGDHGISGKFELSVDVPLLSIMQKLNYQPDIIAATNFFELQPTIYGFYDGGRVWNINYRKSFQKEHDSAVSRGFGLRGKLANYFIYDAYIAEPMTRTAQNEQDKQPRYFFNVGFSYS